MPYQRLTSEQEQGLVMRARQDPDGMRDLYQHYVASIYTYIASQVAQTQDAEDLVSETFMKALEHIDTFCWQGNQSLSAWLFRIAHNTLQDFRRQRARHQAPLPLDEVVTVHSPTQPPDAVVMQQEEFAQLHHLISTLPLRRREVVLLKFFGGLRNQEIATILELDERTVAAHLCRALSDLYRKYCNELGDVYEHSEWAA